MCSLWFYSDAFAQKLSFGVVVGANFTDDFRSGTVVHPRLGTCPEQLCNSTALFNSDDASGRFILGPKLELTLSKPLSLEVEALHRAVRRKTRIQYSPPIDSGNGVIISSQASTETDYTWEFPVLANYKFRAFRINSFVELGPTFRPAENNEQYGVTGAAGVEMSIKSLKIAPRLRYTRWIDKDYGPDPTFRLLRPRPSQMAVIIGISQLSSSSAPVSAFGQDLSVGAVVGMGLTEAFRGYSVQVQGMQFLGKFSESKNSIVGLALEFEPIRNLFLELDGLYRPLHVRDENISVPGEGGRTNEGFSVLTWEFPVLTKYKWKGSNLRPFVEIGPSFRATGNLNGYDPSHYGITGGVGIETHFGKLKISPAVRYNRWQADNKQPGTISNQAELIVALSF